jgi:hypothetical protein
VLEIIPGGAVSSYRTFCAKSDFSDFLDFDPKLLKKLSGLNFIKKKVYFMSKNDGLDLGEFST